MKRYYVISLFAKAVERVDEVEFGAEHDALGGEILTLCSACAGEYMRDGYTLKPVKSHKDIVMFCDECGMTDPKSKKLLDSD